MSFTPSTLAQAVATSCADNLANLASALTAMQTSIAGGNLGPAAYIDGILGVVGVQKVQIVAPFTDSNATATYADIQHASITFTPPVTRQYFIIALADVFFNPAGAGNVRIKAAGTGLTARLVDGQVTANQFIPVTVFDVVTLNSGGARTITLQWAATTGTICTTGGTSSIFYAIL